MFSPTLIHESKILPGVRFTVHRMGFGRRTDLDFLTSRNARACGSSRRITPNKLGKKRYGIEIATKAYELQAKPAEVIEMPKRPGN